MQNKNETWRAVGAAWNQLAIRLAAAVPNMVIAEHDENETVSNRKRLHRVVIRVLAVMVVTLALASIGNMVSRARIHHSGFNAYAGGISLAALVPITVFVTAALFRGDKRRRTLGWSVSAVFAGVSATIQYFAYSAGSETFALEAFAFGAGIPISECLLAVLAAAVESQVEEEEAAENEQQRMAADEARQAAGEAAQSERQRVADDERRRAELAFELEQKRLDADARRENERIKARAAADAKRIKAENAGVSGNVSRHVSGDLSKRVSTSASPEVAISPEDMTDALLEYIRDNAGETGGQIAKAHQDMASQSTVYRALALLENGNMIAAVRDGRAKRWSATIAPALPEPAQIHLNGNEVTHE